MHHEKYHVYCNFYFGDALYSLYAHLRTSGSCFVHLRSHFATFEWRGGSSRASFGPFSSVLVISLSAELVIE